MNRYLCQFSSNIYSDFKSYFIVSFPILGNSILFPLQYTFLFYSEIPPQSQLSYSNHKLIHYSPKLLMKHNNPKFAQLNEQNFH